MEHPHKLVYTAQVPIRWGDMDAVGHVNNTLYFRYMEQARLEWMESLGLLGARHHEGSPVIVNASCTFLIPFTYPGTVELRVSLGRPGRSSVVSYYDMRLVGEETIYAEAAAKIVWTDPATGKSIPLPEAMRRLAE